MAVNMDDATARTAFFRDLPGKYKTNADGFACNPNLEKRKYLKRLKEVLKSNVLDKLRSCRDETLAMELMWHRNCQWQQKYEDNDLYLQPQYNPECGKGRLHGDLAKAGVSGYVMDFAETKGKLPNGGGVVTATADAVYNAWKSVKHASGTLPAFNDSPADANDMLTNFFLHHDRVRDKIATHSKIQRCDAAIAELRSIDYSFMLWCKSKGGRF
jgi:hypothetical protein